MSLALRDASCSIRASNWWMSRKRAAAASRRAQLVAQLCGFAAELFQLGGILAGHWVLTGCSSGSEHIRAV